MQKKTTKKNIYINLNKIEDDLRSFFINGFTVFIIDREV